MQTYNHLMEPHHLVIIGLAFLQIISRHLVIVVVTVAAVAVVAIIVAVIAVAVVHPRGLEREDYIVSKMRRI